MRAAIASQLTLGQLIGAAEAAPWGNVSLQGISDDSRRVRRGDVFVACPGVHHDGRDFIDAAIGAGARVVLAEAEGPFRAEERRGVPVIYLPELSRKLSALAGHFFADPSAQLTVFGITGTNGKTTCSYLLAQLCTALGERTAVIGTLGYGLVGSGAVSLKNTGLTTPGPIQLQAIIAELKDAGADAVAMEFSSHSLDQFRADGVAVDVALFTNLSRDHLDYHGSEDSYLAAKLRLFGFESLSCAVVNLDDAAAHQVMNAAQGNCPVLTYSTCGQPADLQLQKIQQEHGLTRFELRSIWGSGTATTGLAGDFNLSNLAATLTVLLSRGIELQRLLPLIPSLQAVAGRMEPANSAEDDIAVVIDFAHTPDALEKVLQAFSERGASQLWCVFGCGGDRDQGKRALMGQAACEAADRVVLTSDNPRYEDPQQILDAIVQGCDRAKVWQVEADRQQAITRTILAADAGDTVVIAGKGHEDYQEVRGTKRPFSDLECARAALALRRETRRGGGDA